MTRFEKTLLMEFFFVKIEFDASLISSTLTCMIVCFALEIAHFAIALQREISQKTLLCGNQFKFVEKERKD